jgi:hypothetical protein
VFLAASSARRRGYSTDVRELKCLAPLDFTYRAADDFAPGALEANAQISPAQTLQRLLNCPHDECTNQISSARRRWTVEALTNSRLLFSGKKACGGFLKNAVFIFLFIAPPSRTVLQCVHQH